MTSKEALDLNFSLKGRQLARFRRELRACLPWVWVEQRNRWEMKGIIGGGMTLLIGLWDRDGRPT